LNNPGFHDEALPVTGEQGYSLAQRLSKNAQLCNDPVLGVQFIFKSDVELDQEQVLHARIFVVLDFEEFASKGLVTVTQKIRECAQHLTKAELAIRCNFV